MFGCYRASCCFLIHWSPDGQLSAMSHFSPRPLSGSESLKSSLNDSNACGNMQTSVCMINSGFKQYRCLRLFPGVLHHTKYFK